MADPLGYPLALYAAVTRRQAVGAALARVTGAQGARRKVRQVVMDAMPGASHSESHSPASTASASALGAERVIA